MSQHRSPLRPSPSIGLPLPPFPTSSSSYPPEAARLAPQHVEEGDRLPPGLADDVAEQLEEFLVAVPGLAGQRGGGQTLGPLLLHQLVLPLLGLRELGGDDHQTQVDHEEGTHLTG